MSTEQDAVAVERVSAGLRDNLGQWDYLATETWESIATAAITAYNAVLRERSRDADVVDATATAMFLATGIERHAYRAQAKPVVTAALDAILGKEPGE